MAKKDQATEDQATEKTKLVKMVRGEETADVDPREVDNFAAGGWQKA